MNNNYYDDFEKQTEKLLNQLEDKKASGRIPLLEKAASLILKSKNPESKEIHNLLKGISCLTKGQIESNHLSSVKYYNKAISHFKKLKIDNKVNHEIHQARVLKYRRELQLYEDEIPKQRDLFLKIAKEDQILGNNREYHISMGLYYYFNGVLNFEVDIEKSLIELDKSSKEFRLAKKTQFIPKVKGLKYRLIAYYQPDYKSMINQLRLALKEYSKSDDKFGICEINASINFAEAKIESDLNIRLTKYVTAARLYKKEGYKIKSHNSLGWARITNTKLNENNYSAIYRNYKIAAKHFSISNDKISFNRSNGYAYLTLGIIEGIIKSDDKKFIENLSKANFYLAHSGNTRFTNFTAGILLFSNATSLPYDKAKVLFKKSAEILQSIDEELYHIAFYHYYYITFNQPSLKPEEVLKFKFKALDHLDKWLSYFERMLSKTYPFPTLFNHQAFFRFLKAEYFNLKASVELNKKAKIKYFKDSLEYYSLVLEEGYLEEKVHRARGWVYMNLFEFDKAYDDFNHALKNKPFSTAIAEEKKLALEYLKKGFKDLKLALKKETKFRVYINQLLSKEISVSQNYFIDQNIEVPNQTFFHRALNDIQKAGKIVEENYANHVEKDEEALRDELLQCLMMLYSNVSAESKKALGKRDLTIKDELSSEELISECLIWKGKKYYEQKKNQLFNRYLTWHDKEACLITFVRNSNFKNIIDIARKSIKNLDSVKLESFHDLSSKNTRLFLSLNAHKSGSEVKLYHLFFHLPLHK